MLNTFCDSSLFFFTALPFKETEERLFAGKLIVL